MSNWVTLSTLAHTHTTEDETTWIHLSKYALLKIEGDDAETFLQGQCTNDFSTLDVGSASYGAHCNAKGRMMSSFLAAHTQPNTFYLRVESSLISIVKAELGKYIIFSKSQLNVCDDITCLAIAGPDAEKTVHILREKISLHYCHSHANNFFECWIDHTDLDMASICLSEIKKSSIKHWEQRMITLGIAEVTAETSSKYLPQEFNFDHLGAVSFKKGCFTGQEVIARLHYRGKLKSHLYLGAVSTKLPLTNAHLYDATNNSACGEVLRQVKEGDKTLFLALASDASVQNKTCVIELNSNTEIKWQSLSYAIT